MQKEIHLYRFRSLTYTTCFWNHFVALNILTIEFIKNVVLQCISNEWLSYRVIHLMMRLQRRLYGIYNVCFFIFMIPCNYKLLSFFIKSLNKLFKDNIQGITPNLNLGSLYLQSFNFKVVCAGLSFVVNPENSELKYRTEFQAGSKSKQYSILCGKTGQYIK